MTPPALRADSGGLPSVPGPVESLYHLEDASDSSGNGCNLTPHGAVSYTTGKLANGVDFGTSNHDQYLGYTASNMGLTWNSPQSLGGF